MRISFTEISPLVITKSSVFPAVCVGIFTSWTRSNCSRRDFNFFASASVSMLTWNLKSPTIRCFALLVCRKLISSLNWEEKSCACNDKIQLYVLCPYDQHNCFLVHSKLCMPETSSRMLNDKIIAMGSGYGSYFCNNLHSHSIRVTS